MKRINTEKTHTRLFYAAIAVAVSAHLLQGCGKKKQDTAHSSGDAGATSDQGSEKVDSAKPSSELTDIAKAADSLEKSEAWINRKSGAVRLRRQALEALDRAKTDKDRRDEASRYANAFEFQNATEEEWKIKSVQDALYADAMVELGRDWVRYIDKNIPNPDLLTASQKALIESWSDQGPRGSLLDVLFQAYDPAMLTSYPKLSIEAIRRERYWVKLLPMVQKLLMERVWSEMSPVWYDAKFGWGKNMRYQMDLRRVDLATLQGWTSRLNTVIQSHSWLLRHDVNGAAIGSQILYSWNRLDFVAGSFSSPGTSPDANQRALTLQLFRDQINLILQSD